MNVNVALAMGQGFSIKGLSTNQIVAAISQGAIVDPKELEQLPPQESQSIYDALSKQTG